MQSEKLKYICNKTWFFPTILCPVQVITVQLLFVVCLFVNERFWLLRFYFYIFIFYWKSLLISLCLFLRTCVLLYTGAYVHVAVCWSIPLTKDCYCTYLELPCGFYTEAHSMQYNTMPYNLIAKCQYNCRRKFCGFKWSHYVFTPITKYHSLTTKVNIGVKGHW